MLRRRMMVSSVQVGPVDLSMVNNAGKRTGSMTTANCYLVHNSGDYKLPLVYGNAIKNNEVNTEAFNPTGTSSDTFLKPFINHANQKITGPWITKSGSGVNAGMGLTASTAELLWQDSVGVISSVGVDGDYLMFNIDTFTPGNAVIAIKDANGTILWSWHIWATNDNLSNTTVVSTGQHSYTVAPVNLGWIPTGGDGKKGYCPYYQGGRKDPFIPTVPNSSTDHTVYDINGNAVTGINFSNSNVTFADNIKNPTTYYVSQFRTPTSSYQYNVWDAQNTTTGNVSTATKKTIYDPCPPGFCVPTSNLWYYFGNGGNRSDSNWDSTNNGKTWTQGGASIYFPALGERGMYSTGVSGINSYGYYKSSTQKTNIDQHQALSFNRSQWSWTSQMKALGGSIRPVAEE